VVDALSPVEVSLLNAKLSALEACLEPGLTSLNWNSRGIDSFVATTTKAINEFQALHHSVKKNSAIVEKLVNGLAATQLVADLPAGAQQNLPEHPVAQHVQALFRLQKQPQRLLCHLCWQLPVQL
jgi:hypothetical protein